MVRVFNGRGEAITSHQHVELEIPGAVQVVIKELADEGEVVATLLRIAAVIEAEGKAKKGLDRD